MKNNFPNFDIFYDRNVGIKIAKFFLKKRFLSEKEKKVSEKK